MVKVNTSSGLVDVDGSFKDVQTAVDLAQIHLDQNPDDRVVILAGDTSLDFTSWQNDEEQDATTGWTRVTRLSQD